MGDVVVNVVAVEVGPDSFVYFGLLSAIAACR